MVLREPTSSLVGVDRSHMRFKMDEVEVIHDVLFAVVWGPFCVDGEFQTITNVSLQQVEALLQTWPAYPAEDERLVVRIVERSLWAVLTYPSAVREDAWPRWLGVSPDTVEGIRQKWACWGERVG